MIRLDKSNIDREIKNYLRKTDAIEIPERRGTNLEHLLSLKRGKIANGPYPNVSIFEASNRIFSDIVILFGIRELLIHQKVGKIILPFTQYEAKLGNEDGFDITANTGNEKLLGEAFNVASSYFQSKKWAAKNKLQAEVDCDFRILVFNIDAVKNVYNYHRKSEKSMMYLPVDWEEGMNAFQSRTE